MADKFWEKEKEMLRLPKGKDEVVVTECEKNEKVYYDIREYYTDATGEQKPSKKGIVLSKEILEAIVEAFNKTK